MRTTTLKPKWWLQWLSPLFFFLSGIVFLPYPGLQNDEALLAGPLFRIDAALYHPKLFNRQIPLMLLSYLGTVKSVLLGVVFRVFSPNPYSLRIPGLLLGALTVWILYLLLQKIHGKSAALIGSALLATDSVFLLTSCFDWGPVAAQHLLSILGVLLLIRFFQSGQPWPLAAGSFCFGLALWDKALFLWLFGGLIVAAFALYPSQILRRISLRNLGMATAAFTLGCLPLVFYNVNRGYPTFHSTSGFSANDLESKSMVLRSTWEGSTLFGYIPQEDWAGQPKPPSGILEIASFRLREATGEHRRNAMNYAFLAALLCLPWLRRTEVIRPILFCFLAFAAGWFQMAVTNGAGGAAHHAILLWPLPHIFVALAFAETARRWVRFGHPVFLFGTLALLISNLLVTNQYFYQFARNGSAGSWTDAIYPLSADLEHYGNTPIAVVDWGIVNSLDVLNRGRLNLVWQGDPFLPPAPGQQPPAPDPNLLDPKTEALWIGHVDGQEQFAGVNAAIAQFAKRNALRILPLKTYYDRNGRSVFQSFRFAKPGG